MTDQEAREKTAQDTIAEALNVSPVDHVSIQAQYVLDALAADGWAVVRTHRFAENVEWLADIAVTHWEELRDLREKINALADELDAKALSAGNAERATHDVGAFGDEMVYQREKRVLTYAVRRLRGLVSGDATEKSTP